MCDIMQANMIINVNHSGIAYKEIFYYFFVKDSGSPIVSYDGAVL